jgi:hypothetical protein
VIAPEQEKGGRRADLPPNARETIDVGLDLVDRQLLDKAGKPIGKIDDLELTSDEGAPPVLTAILTGPGALSPRVGPIGSYIARLRLRLRAQDQPARVDFASVHRMGSDVRLAVSRDQLEHISSEPWARKILSRIGMGR